MLRMRMEGKSHEEIGKHFGITRQRVQQLLKPYPVSRKYVVDGDESAQDSRSKGVKGLLDKIVLKVKKFV